QEHLAQSGVPVFHGYHRLPPAAHVIWDTERHPDFREFVEAARQSGAHLLIFNHHAFSLDRIDEALEELEDADLTREEKRNYETRLKKLRDYEGFTCSVELSFTLDGTLYSFESHTEWFESFTDTVGEIEALAEDQDIEEDDDSLGGYFSKN
ncbi:MAG: hypothetical protein JO033_20465, partial [Acidobacteriaceae bacterium]|nr:hypothetical protein [Acidobacteriaceae bacterium]